MRETQRQRRQLAERDGDEVRDEAARAAARRVMHASTGAHAIVAAAVAATARGSAGASHAGARERAPAAR